MDFAEHFRRVDFAPRHPLQIGNRSFRHRQAFQFLLCDRSGHGPHVALNLFLC
jgi:hypothetical protein